MGLGLPGCLLNGQNPETCLMRCPCHQRSSRPLVAQEREDNAPRATGICACPSFPHGDLSQDSLRMENTNKAWPLCIIHVVTHPIPACMWGGSASPHTSRQFWDTGWVSKNHSVLTLSIWRYSRFHSSRLSPPRAVVGPGCYLCF